MTSPDRQHPGPAPSQAEVWAAQKAALATNSAGLTDAEYRQRLAARADAEARYLAQWGSLPPEPRTDAELAAEARREAWGPQSPVPFSLTPAAEAALDDPPALSRYPGINDPEQLAQWCGFASAADMCAAYEEYARDLEARAAAEAQEEAELEAAYEAEWADNWDSQDAAAYMDRVEAGLEPEAEP